MPINYDSVTPLELFSLNYFDTTVSPSVRSVTIATLRLN